MFKPAYRRSTHLKIMLIGPSGAGCTLTALLWAKEIANGRPVAVLDTRWQGAELYAGWPDGRGGELRFDVAKVTSNEPNTYKAAINAAIAGGYGCLVIDSLSDAWAGADGLLELVDATSNGGGWKKWGPLAKKMHAMIAAADLHIIVTVRAKIVHAPTTDIHGRPAMTKLASTPLQGDGLEYSYTVVAELDRPENEKVHGYFSKTLVSGLRGITFENPGPNLASPMLEWAGLAEAVPEATEAANPTQPQANTVSGGAENGPLPVAHYAAHLCMLLAHHGEMWSIDNCMVVLGGLVERRQRDGKPQDLEVILADLGKLSSVHLIALAEKTWAQMTTPTPAK